MASVAVIGAGLTGLTAAYCLKRLGARVAGVAPGRYAFLAFPLRWVGADASPVRAALRAIEGPPRALPTEGP